MTSEYPKHPNRYHWRKRFLIPKPYLYKMRVLEGFTVEEIAKWHHKELGVKISIRLVNYYLAKFKIRKPKNLSKKKKRKWLPFNEQESVWYINRCLQWNRFPFRYLDKLSVWKRRKVVNRFFRMSDELDHVTREQRNILWSVFKIYEVGSGTADLFFLHRDVMIDWGKVDALRADSGISIDHFCEKIKVDKRNYRRFIQRGFIRANRKSVVKIRHVLPCVESKFSKEIKNEKWRFETRRF